MKSDYCFVNCTSSSIQNPSLWYANIRMHICTWCSAFLPKVLVTIQASSTKKGQPKIPYVQMITQNLHTQHCIQIIPVKFSLGRNSHSSLQMEFAYPVMQSKLFMWIFSHVILPFESPCQICISSNAIQIIHVNFHPHSTPIDPFTTAVHKEF
jgi:hypothetical protein